LVLGTQKAQALVVIALMMTVLILFMGLGVDAGNLMGKTAKLQSAVDAAALSAAQMMGGSGAVTQTATTKAYQILEANGIPSNTLVLRQVDFPGPNQVHVKATQNVPTYFMRLIPMWRTVPVTAQATADLNSYAEITTKPYGVPGVVNELNMMVWGVDSWRRGGDVYSPAWLGGTVNPNPEYPKQPYGYLFRIDVPPGYSSSHLLVELFDPDTYNKPAPPPAWPTANPTGTPGPTPQPSADQYASCGNPRPGTCTSNGQNYDTGMKLNAFTNGLPAFWRVDEIRTRYNEGTSIAGIYDAGHATNTQFTLWHFNPHITTAFGDPSTLSDQAGGAYLARYTIGWDSTTDLSWIRPSGFDITLRDGFGNDQFEREANGGFYFYLYIQGIGGSSENNYDIRVGPPESNAGGCSAPCYVNQMYLNNSYAWQDGGARIFAKRALPLNLVTGASFPLMFTQVSKNAAGVTLGIRHFDQDCNNGCGSIMQYQMQICGCTDLSDPACWSNITQGYVGDNDSWTDGVHPDPEPVSIPFEGTTQYDLFFGNAGQCPTSWLRIQQNPSYSGDTTVWEMPYIRPRIIK
jgi:hypothetical protein